MHMRDCGFDRDYKLPGPFLQQEAPSPLTIETAIHKDSIFRSWSIISGTWCKLITCKVQGSTIKSAGINSELGVWSKSGEELW